jgi:dihydrofolate synthase/folylpolyglutamate synthase
MAAAFPALDWLYSTQLFGIKLGLDSMHRLVSALELSPQRIIHVAGTNGKGSTCAMMASIAQAAGLKVGLFTSPHLISFCERIRINGRMITEAEVTAGLERIRTLAGGWEPHPTFFEITTALALAYFAEQKVDLIVLETGMGGRLDATNVVQPLVSVITPIALDHQQWLGQTLAEIAGEKAGIIKPGAPVVSAPQAPEAAAVLRSHGPVQFINHHYQASEIALAGEHQQSNAAVAVAALRAAGYAFPSEIIAQGLANTHWPARFQRVGDSLVIDGAHNPAGAEVLAHTWQHYFPSRKAHLIFGAVAAKDVRKVLEILRPLVASASFITLQSPRAMPAAELLTIWQSIAPDIPVQSTRSLASLLQTVPHPILVTGSLYLCGETLALLDKERSFEVSAQ